MMGNTQTTTLFHSLGNPEGKTMKSGEIGGPDVFGVAPRSLETGDYSIVASNGKSREGHVLG